MNASGLYSAPASNGTAVIRVVDSTGSTALAFVTISNGGGSGAALVISPTSKTLALNNNFVFNASGGTPPYTYTMLSGVGSVSGTTGIYSATSVGSGVVRVTDSIGNTADASVIVNAALSISPNSGSVAINNTLSFSAAGGVAPYSYSVVSGGGVISGAVYTAPASAGAATVRVTDVNGNTADALVTINAALSLSPASKLLAVNNNATFTASGGVAPYTYNVLVGGAGGSVGSSGVYTAPSSLGADTVRVTDALGNMANASVTINPALAISPTSQTLALNTSFTFGATGGVSPYAYSMVSGVGSISVITGLYSATSTGSATVRVTDSLGNSSNATVTVNAALSISSNRSQLAPGNSATLSASGGVSPYTFTISSGGGSVSGTTFTAPGTAGSVVIQGTDSLGNTATTTITINSALSISPSSKTLAVANSSSFSASGGVSPYSYSVVAGGVGGTINSATGIYTAPGSSGSDTVRVTDALGNTSNATVSVNAALAISPSSVTIGLNNNYTFTASGGVAPYTYIVASGVGSIGSNSGVYNGSSTGSATVRVTDSIGNISNAAVTVSGGLVLSVDHPTLAITNTATLSASGGVSPYSYSVISGGGSISGTTFTAPGTAGSTTLRVTDNLGNTNDAVVTTNAALTITPSSRSLTTANTYTFVASNGVAPYAFSIQSGVGSVGASTGVYSSASTGSAVVKVTDALNNTATANVTVLSPLAISPTSKTLTITNSWTFSASGGVTPYVYSISSGGVGSINSTTGVYTAPAGAGSATVVVTDAVGNTSNSAVTVNANLTMSPSTYTLAVNNTYTFTGLGGVPPYAYTMQAGSGSINGSSGLYTAPAGSGSATVKVTDSAAATATSTVTINAALAVSPGSFSLALNNNKTITVSGGVPPYSYSSTIGSVTVATSTTAIFTAPGSAGSGTITATDAVGNTYNVSVTVNAALAISPTTWTGSASGVTKTFSASGGSGSGYTYSTTIGSINSSTGVLTPPASNGSGTVTVTDSLSNTAAASITINSALAASPTSKTLAVGNSFTFSATGGVTPYSYSITAGSGSFSGAVYTAPGASGSATLRVTDAVGNTANCSVTINAALAISPTTKTLMVGNNTTFTASGGVSPYAFSAVSGTINTSTGAYVAPASAGSDTVTVTDALGNIMNASVTANAALALSPSTLRLLINDEYNFSASGGVLSYGYSVFSGSGSISGSGLFTAGSAADTSVARVTDSLGNYSSATVTTATFATADDFQYVSGYPSVAQSIAQAGSTLYAAGYGTHSSSGVHWIVRKSADAGVTWSTVDDYQLTASQPASAYGVATDSTGTNVYVTGYAKDASGYQYWITRASTNSGSSWTTIDNFQYSSTKAATGTQAVVMSNGDVYVAGTAANASSINYSIVRQLPNGGSWSTVDTNYKNFANPNVYILKSPSNTLYTLSSCNGTPCFSGASNSNWLLIRRSTDGTTWTQMSASNLESNGFYPGAIDYLGTLYMFRGLASYMYNLYYSTDNGATLATKEFNSNGGNYNVLGGAVAAAPNGTIYYGQGGTYSYFGPTEWWVRKTRTDGSLTYVDRYSLSSGMAAGVYSMAADNSHVYAVGSAADASNIAHWIFRKY